MKKTIFGRVLGGGYKCSKGHHVPGSVYPCPTCQEEKWKKEQEKKRKAEVKLDAKIRKKMGLPPLRKDL